MDVLIDTLLDSVKILPFLFVTYLLMEYLEHRTEEGTSSLLEKAGRYGPLFGGAFGVIPQCGFSAAASNLYAGRVITTGTLIAVYLSTSDEMLPLMIADRVGVTKILSILVTKAVIGIVVGFLIDFVIHAFRRAHSKKETDDLRIEELCEREHCHCDDDEEGGVLKSAIIHTRNIFFFVVILTFMLNLVIGLVGEEALSALLQQNSLISHVLAAVIGLIPNCAASIIITTLYLDGMITAGTMMSGLLVGAGIGLLVLFRVNRDIKENILLTALLFVCGLTCGALIDLMGVMF